MSTITTTAAAAAVFATASNPQHRPSPRHIDAAEVAKMIRAHLKRTFPGTAFSVRLRRYAGGSSIDVHWTDGPTDAMVDAEVGDWNGHRFDSMIDMAFSQSHWLMPDGTLRFAETGGSQDSMGVYPEAVQGCPAGEGGQLVRLGNSYTFTNRHVSAAHYTRVSDAMCDYLHIERRAVRTTPVSRFSSGYPVVEGQHDYLDDVAGYHVNRPTLSVDTMGDFVQFLAHRIDARLEVIDATTIDKALEP